MIGASAKADFLRIRAELGLDPDALRALAPMLGFKAPEDDAWEPAPPTVPVSEASSADSAERSDDSASSARRGWPTVPFFRTEAVEHGPAVPEVSGPLPAVVGPLPPEAVAALRDLDFPRTQPQASWEELWPTLFELVGEERSSREVDAEALVDAVSRLRPMSTVPRRRRKVWPERLELLMDRSTHLLPLWTDQNEVAAGLERLLGPGRVGRVDLFTARRPHVPCPATTCLALTDLGAYGSSAHRAWWQREARRRAARRQQTVALVPLAPSQAAGTSVAGWRRRSWGPPHTWHPIQRPAAREERAHRLLELVCTSDRVDHGWLRGVRKQLGLPSGDLVTELDAWNGPWLDTGAGLAAGWTSGAAHAMRAEFLRATRVADKALAVRELKRWHGSVFERDIWREDIAILRELMVDAPSALRSAIEAAIEEVANPLDDLGARVYATMLEADLDVVRVIAGWLRDFARRSPHVFARDGVARDGSHDVNIWFEALLAAPASATGQTALGAGVEPSDLRRTRPHRDVSSWTWRHAPHGLTLGGKAGSPVLTLEAGVDEYVSTMGEAAQRRRFDGPAVLPVAPADLPRADPSPWSAQGRDEYGRWAEVNIEGVPLRMRWIEPGTFRMGSPEDEEGRWGDEGPRHEVTLTEGYWLAETPCTQALWHAVTGQRPSRFEGADLPVEQVSYADVVDFIDQLNARVPGLDLRLPTEAQWERACRAGSDEARYGALDDVAWLAGNSGQRTHPVAGKQANRWGLFDMLGNVWEWCWDWDGPYSGEPAVNPTGPKEGAGRVLRGGSWADDAQGARAACRYASDPSYRSSSYGFRLSRGPSAPSQAEPGGLGTRPGPRGTRGRSAVSRPEGAGRSSPSGIVLITDRAKAWLGVFERPEWASHVGRDRFGLFADVEVEADEAVVPVTFRMRWIAAGRFWMGSAASEEGELYPETPRHLVTLTEGYWLADTPCTQALWEAVTKERPSQFEGPGNPVEQVSWEDVQEFLQRLDDRVPGLAPRLPTEAQWEHACRAGSEEARHPDLDAVAWFGGNSGGRTQPVATRQANPWGLYDMLGNVWEWCQDWAGPYDAAPAVDPIGPSEGTRRVLRGGSWNSVAQLARAACRIAHDPSSRYSYYGFRLSRGQSAPSPSVGRPSSRGTREEPADQADGRSPSAPGRSPSAPVRSPSDRGRSPSDRPGPAPSAWQRIKGALGLGGEED